MGTALARALCVRGPPPLHRIIIIFHRMIMSDRINLIIINIGNISNLTRIDIDPILINQFVTHNFFIDRSVTNNIISC